MNIDGVLTQLHQGGSGGFLLRVMKLSPEKKTQVPSCPAAQLGEEGHGL